MTLHAAEKLIGEARRIAAEYRRTTGKSLGISSEISKHDGCYLLGLEPVSEQVGGYDATDSDGKKIQIKGRVIFDESKGGQRLGQLKLEQDWDAVILVLMDENFDTFEIYQTWREDIIDALDQSNRNKRGAMSIARFKNIANLVWTREEGLVSE